MNDDEELLNRRHLGWRVAACLPEGPCALLVVSPRNRDARQPVAEAVAAEMARERKEPVRLLALEDLSAYPDPDLAETVLVIGPALLEGAALLDIPRPWLQRFDASIIVSTKDKTRLRDLLRARDRLDAMGIEALGVVWWRARPAARRGLAGALRRAVLSRFRRGRGAPRLAHDG
jgi:hypothetical protein